MLTKEECIAQRYWDEQYFTYGTDENGYLAIYDRETGEKVATTKFRRRTEAKR